MPGDPGAKGEKVAPSYHLKFIHCVVNDGHDPDGFSVYREKWETVTPAPEDHQDLLDLQDQASDL